jgi:cyclopropane-fatty-acyl-phospholipid synthase
MSSTGDTAAMKDTVRRNFDASVSAYDAYEHLTGRFSTLTRLLWTEMASRGPESPGPILDAGAGSGVSTRELATHVPRVVALDISRGMLRKNPGSERVQADFDSLPFPSDTFDAVAYTASLFLVPEPGRAVEEAARTLRDGGVIGAVAPLGWYNEDGEDIFDALSRESRSPTSATDVTTALSDAFETTTGVWSFPTTATTVRQFHEIPAMAARLYPRSSPDERVRRAGELLDSLDGTFEQRWRWIVGTD